MGCCGQKRAALRVRATVPAASHDTVAHRPDGEGEVRSEAGSVMVEYRGGSPAVLHLAASGRLYTFSLVRPVRSIPAADAAKLLLNQDFRRTQH